MYLTVEARTDVDEVFAAMSTSEKQNMLQRLIETMEAEDLRAVTKKCKIIKPGPSTNILSIVIGGDPTFAEQEFANALHKLRMKYISLSPGVVDEILQHAKEL